MPRGERRSGEGEVMVCNLLWTCMSRVIERQWVGEGGGGVGEVLV